jgi:hypothetical protein
LVERVVEGSKYSAGLLIPQNRREAVRNVRRANAMSRKELMEGGSKD